MKNEEIMVSVCCLVYNHEKYLRRCLDGIVMQKTNFKFEVLIHDDASTDHSEDIIREYEAKYPDIIKPIYQTENQYSKGVAISQIYQYPRAKGKYFAFCEGDDFWIDENKLQIQYNALESHIDCCICVHNTRCINEDGSNNDRVFPSYSFENDIVIGEDILKKYPDWIFHLTSFFVRRNVVMDLNYSNLNFAGIAPVGDTELQYFAATQGNYYYIDKYMSTYRLFSKGSWTSRIRNGDKIIEVNNKFIKYTETFQQYVNGNCCFDLDDVFKNAIVQYKIGILLYERKYREIYKFKNSNYYHSLNKKLRWVIYLSVFVPGFEKLYKRRKG